MSYFPTIIPILLFALGAALTLSGLCVAAFRKHHHHIRLHLRIHSLRKGFHMAAIGDVSVASIHPTNAAGQAAPVDNITWTLDSAAYAFAPPVPGATSVQFTAIAAGDCNVTVTATSKAGVTLTDTKPLPSVVADVEAVALNLQVA